MDKDGDLNRNSSASVGQTGETLGYVIGTRLAVGNGPLWTVFLQANPVLSSGFNYSNAVALLAAS